MQQKTEDELIIVAAEINTSDLNPPRAEQNGKHIMISYKHGISSTICKKLDELLCVNIWFSKSRFNRFYWFSQRDIRFGLMNETVLLEV